MGRVCKRAVVSARHHRNSGLMVQYASGLGLLPDDLTQRAVWTRYYSRRLVVNPTALKERCLPQNFDERAAFVRFIQLRLLGTSCFSPISRTPELNTWGCRNASDFCSVAELHNIVSLLPSTGTELSPVTADLYAWTTPILFLVLYTRKQHQLSREDWTKMKYKKR